MSTAYIIKLLFCFKLLFILLGIFLIFKLIMLFLHWKKHKILMLPKLIFVIICLIIGIKGYAIIHNIQSNAQTHEERIIKEKNATKRLYNRKGSEAIAKQAGKKAKYSSQKLLHEAKLRYYKYKVKHNHYYKNSGKNSKQLQQDYEDNRSKIKNLQNHNK